MKIYILLLLIFLQNYSSQIIDQNDTGTLQHFGISPLRPLENQQLFRKESILSDNTTDIIDVASCTCINCYQAVVINFYENYIICPSGDFVDVSINIQNDIFSMNIIVGEFVQNSIYYSFENVTCLNVNRIVSANTAAVNITCLQSALCTIQNAIKFTCTDSTLLSRTIPDNNDTSTTVDSTNRTVVIIILISVISLLLLLLTGINVCFITPPDSEE